MKPITSRAIVGGLGAGLLVALAACDPGPTSSRGFRLPDGDVEAGKAAFVALRCNACHTVEGTQLPPPETTGPVEVHLGGKVHRVRTYGELVTAIIHPSFDLARGYPAEEISRDGTSIMPDFDSAMTVRQMVDLVAFLQSTYSEYLPDEYAPYFP